MGRKAALVAWLRELDVQGIRDVLSSREDAARTRPHSLRALADELTTTASLRIAVEGLDQGARDVLDAVARLGGRADVEAVAEQLRCNGKAARAELKRVLAQLRARALVWPAGGGVVGSPGLRPLLDEPARRITPAPRLPRRTAQHRGYADRAGIAPATSTVDGTTRLLAFCDLEPVACRSGLGLRELRRIAGVLRAEEARVRLWVELAVEVRLLAAEGGWLLPTTRSDAWRAAPTADRLAALVEAWPRLAGVPGRQRQAVVEPSPSDGGGRARRGVLARYAELGPDEAFEHRHEVVAELAWSRPAVWGAGVAEAVLVEAESLGLVALGALTSLGRVLLEGGAGTAAGTGGAAAAGAGGAAGTGGVAAVAGRFVPPSVSTADLRPDLTAVVEGLPDRELSAVLELVAEEAGGSGGVWRFGGAGVRRALDLGHEPDALLARLGAVAAHGVPAALADLVREVARQHGRITVVPVACCVRTADPVLLAEIAARRSLASLGLRPLGPTVLASTKPVAETLALLRAAGYAPASAGADGAPVVARVPRQRATPPPVRRGGGVVDGWGNGRRGEPLGEQDLSRLAVALVDRERPRQWYVPPCAESRRMGAVRLLRDQSLVLRDSEVLLLAEALVTRTSVEVAVANGPRTAVKHVITPVDHASGNLTATCGPRGEAREFLVSDIRSVRVVARA
ncbi:helicase-associated domain-containing protein [Saccharothrix lopnurensis]|uniref:Helicase-associated domain-containing protein n=1 Tax=Saccharothrix lopnurensis TaxID=1670621 RepID=A0ABW1P0U4_9PSEU